MDDILERTVYCMVDRDSEVRKIAFLLLKDVFGKVTQDVEYLLEVALKSNFYLVDAELKTTFREHGFDHLKLL